MMKVKRYKFVLLGHAVTFALATSASLGAAIAAEDTIVVSADPSGSSNTSDVIKQANIGLLGNKDTLNTPFAVSGYTSKFIEDQQAKNLGEIIQHDSSVRVTSPAGGILDSLMIRGGRQYWRSRTKWCIRCGT